MKLFVISTRYHHNWRQKLIPTIGVEEMTDDTTGAVAERLILVLKIMIWKI